MISEWDLIVTGTTCTPTLYDKKFKRGFGRSFYARILHENGRISGKKRENGFVYFWKLACEHTRVVIYIRKQINNFFGKSYLHSKTLSFEKMNFIEVKSSLIRITSMAII